MNANLLPVAGLILALCQISVALAESNQEARKWLERMIHAAQSLNYEGTFVYVQGQNLESMHIVHSNEGDSERQRMYSLNGTMREVVVKDNKVVCLLPKQSVVFSGNYYNRSPFPISLPRKLDILEENYDFEIIGDDRVAGMHTQVIAIQPRDDLRFGYRLWLENNSGMVLRSALLDGTGRILEQLMFTELEIKQHIDQSLLAPSKPLQQLPSASKALPAGESVEQSQWTVSDLPHGFVRVLHHHFSETSNRSRHLTEHILFTDGLATISIFLERLNGAKPLLEGPSQMGAMNSYGLVVEDYQVVVVGEVPAHTVEKIAASLKYGPGAANQ